MDIIRIEESGENFGNYTPLQSSNGSITTSTTVNATASQLTTLIEQIQSTYSQDIITIANNIERLLLLTSNNGTTLDVNIQGISNNLQDIIELNNILRNLGTSVLVGESIIKVANKIDDVTMVSNNIDATKTISYLALEILALAKIDKEIINMNQYVDKIYALHQKLSSITYLSDNLNSLVSLANIPNAELLNIVDNIPLLNVIRNMEVDLRALACNINLLRKFNTHEMLDLLQHSYDLDIISKTKFRKVARFFPITDLKEIQLENEPSGDIGEIKLAIYNSVEEAYVVKTIIIEDYTIDLENKKVILNEEVPYTFAYLDYITNTEILLS